MTNYLISSSILSANFAQLGEDTKQVIAAGADTVHFDVMDNHYVPNLTMGPMILKALRDYGITVPIDVHLMVKPVDALIKSFADAGASYITFHPEATQHVDRSLQLIKQLGCKSGLALNPTTQLNYLDYVMDKIDIVLIMSVNPGFGGQSFLDSTFKKLNQARRRINNSGKNIRLGVDGGVTVDNIADIATAGADMFVSGSAIFGHSNYWSVLHAMRQALTVISGYG
ncbi:ribulose-phosphate 3-epimerase [secondary endosymbiont of Heteropsylla cubana]|uniref:Ribulose-phosphate 3-epimerase n=1 Tax=secondary endosymbiont of Heteropsylla cubana TaxID=134287 RepID=J3VUJ8_9ENTR|nr:ribulose-phosphate 3-epimerase [secondary endosymbiont of Heteropsylla cubana]AFP85851.1 ribulose-phosphate 3-epimerase [secondary endosymbiont of Heteropsylla cubana]